MKNISYKQINSLLLLLVLTSGTTKPMWRKGFKRLALPVASLTLAAAGRSCGRIQEKRDKLNAKNKNPSYFDLFDLLAQKMVNMVKKENRPNECVQTFIRKFLDNENLDVEVVNDKESHFAANSILQRIYISRDVHDEMEAFIEKKEGNLYSFNKILAPILHEDSHLINNDSLTRESYKGNLPHPIQLLFSRGHEYRSDKNAATTKDGQYRDAILAFLKDMKKKEEETIKQYLYEAVNNDQIPKKDKKMSYRKFEKNFKKHKKWLVTIFDINHFFTSTHPLTKWRIARIENLPTQEERRGEQEKKEENPFM